MLNIKTGLNVLSSCRWLSIEMSSSLLAVRINVTPELHVLPVSLISLLHAGQHIQTQILLVVPADWGPLHRRVIAVRIAGLDEVCPVPGHVEGGESVVVTEGPRYEEQRVKLEVELVSVGHAGQGGGQQGEVDDVGLEIFIVVSVDVLVDGFR